MAYMVVDTGGMSVVFTTGELLELRNTIAGVARGEDQTREWLGVVDEAIELETGDVGEADAVDGVIEEMVVARRAEPEERELG